jgi:hypothetical protein
VLIIKQQSILLYLKKRLNLITDFLYILYYNNANLSETSMFAFLKSCNLKGLAQANPFINYSLFFYFLTLSLIQGSLPPTLSISASNADKVWLSSISNPLVRFLSLTSPVKSPITSSILSPNSILS